MRNFFVPANRLNSVGAKLASFYPAPNMPNQNTFAGQSNNLVIAPNARTDAYDAHVARVDQVLSEKQRFFSRFVRGFRTEVNSTNGYPLQASPQYTDGRLSQGGNFDLTTTSPLQVVNPVQPGATLKGGLTFPTSGNRLPYSRDLNNFQPRVGIAWHPWDKTVIRAGYGLGYLATFTPTPGQGFSTSTPFVASNDANLSFAGNFLNNPYPQGILTPTGSSLGLKTFLGQSISFTNPDRVVPKVHEFSIGVQRELPFRSVLEVSYVGSRSKELDVSHQLDAVTKAQFLQYGGPGVTGTPKLTTSQTNPFAGLLPTTGLNGATTTLQQLLLPYPQFTGVNENNIPIGAAWYNSLQVRLEKRLTHGLNGL